MTQLDPMVLHARSRADRPTVRQRALAALRAGQKVNVFTREGRDAIALLFSARTIGDRVFLYGIHGAALLANPAGAIDAGLAWMA